jgi:phage-related tail fiber protein
MFKHFNDGQINTYSFRVHKTHSLSNSELTEHQFLSASNISDSASYYHFARTNFYLSGSDIAQSNPLFNTYPTVGNQFVGSGIFLSKFHDTGSIVYIPQSKFGDGIKKGSFSLTDNSTSKEIKIVDDKKGNLYSTNAADSQSISALSSSDNYVGNIFYDVGVFTITETGSWSGSSDGGNPNGVINYTDVTSGNYKIGYKGSHEINTYEYVCSIQPNELNETQNITIYKTDGNGRVKDNLTSSYWPNYITEIGLYDAVGELMAISRLSKAIPKSTSLPMRFFIRMDY